MCYIIQLVLAALVSTSHGGNILLTAYIPGSHYFKMVNIGRVLVESGHSVTFVGLIQDNRIQVNDKNFVFHHPSVNESNLTRTRFDELVDFCVKSIIQNSSGRKMYADTMLADPNCRKGWIEIYRAAIHYLTGNNFEQIVSDGNFDLIITEEKISKPITILAHKYKIPVAMSIAEIGYHITRDILNLPYLMNSEPGLFIQVFRGQTPTLWERVVGAYNVFTYAPSLMLEIENMMEPAYRKFGVENVESLQRTIQLFIVNDHFAFSFPFLLPNNVIQVGDMDFKESPPLIGDIKDFIEKQHVPIILIAMGSYIDITWTNWHKALFEVLNELDVAVILKIPSDKHSVKHFTFSQKFFISSWLPQKALLGSGLISIFISHCGNNGRLESAFYKVPILCTPIFAEQALNGEMVTQKGFGEMLLPEEMLKSNIKPTIVKMLQDRDKYISQLTKAVDIWKCEPAKGKDKLMYHLNLLLKYKSLDFLMNNMLIRQNLFEIYNIDIILVMLLSAILALFVLTKCIFYVSKTF